MYVSSMQSYEPDVLLTIFDTYRYAVLLMAASHFAIMNPSKAALIDLLALKARALTEINAAFANPKRAVTDSMIGAVMKMAAYEAVSCGCTGLYFGLRPGLTGW